MFLFLQTGKGLQLGIESLTLEGGGTIEDLDIDFTLPGYPDVELKVCVHVCVACLCVCVMYIVLVSIFVFLFPHLLSLMVRTFQSLFTIWTSTSRYVDYCIPLLVMYIITFAHMYLYISLILPSPSLPFFILPFLPLSSLPSSLHPFLSISCTLFFRIEACS